MKFLQNRQFGSFLVKFKWIFSLNTTLTAVDDIEHDIFSSLQNLSLSEVLVEVEKRGSSFGELLAVPEQDDWVYADGKSASCVVYVFEIYKAAGLFGKLASSIQASEFTVSIAKIYVITSCYHH